MIAALDVVVALLRKRGLSADPAALDALMRGIAAAPESLSGPEWTELVDPAADAELTKALSVWRAELAAADDGLQASPAPPARLADLQSHGALVLGPRSQMDPRALDLTGLRTRLWFDDALVTDVTGGHTAPDIWRLIAWLARHAQARGRALRAGDIVTTGSCTPPVIASEGAHVTGEITGLGRLDLTL